MVAKAISFLSLPAVLILVASSAGCGKNQRPSIHIAAVGPLSGSTAARGKDLADAARLAAEETNAAGGVNGRFIQLDLYDDGDQSTRARELAQQIAKTPAVAVLGQVASSAAFAAGQIYRQERIPALTGAASEARVTKDNEWFFRLLRDAAGQGQFLADYARYQYGAQKLVVLRETGTAGEEFAASMRERARKQHIHIAADIEFTPAEANDPARMRAMAERIAKAAKGSLIVVGTQYAETPGVLVALHDKLGSFVGFGYSSVATEQLPAQLAKAESGRRATGYYTDGLIVAAPQLSDIAGYAQTAFASRFRARYGTDPSPEAVRWYEAAELLIQAINAKRVTGTATGVERRQIRDWLAARNSPDSAAAGVAGPVYFDQDRNVQRGITVGAFYAGRLFSAPVQFTPVADLEMVPGWDRLQSTGMVIDSGKTKVVKTPVVYAGIDLNTLDNVDVRNSTFAADFFVWFRFKDDLNFDVHQIEFPTAVSGGDPGKEIFRRSRGGFTTITHHVKGVFRGDYEFSRFPFDQQVLRIPLQARNSTNYALMLAYSNEPEQAGRKESKDGLSPKLWRLKDEIFFRDVVAFQSSLGDEGSQQAVEADRINAAITIKRDVFGYVVKNFLPLACILIALLVGYALAPDVINPRVSIGVTALLTSSVLYQKVASDLPTVTYIMGLDYVFFAFFAICVLFLLLTVVTYETQRAKLNTLTRRLNHSGWVVTLVALAVTITFVWSRYWGRA